MTKRIGMFAALVATVMFAGGVIAETTIAGGMSSGDGDVKAGKTKSEMCQGCHGANGISIDPASFPNLAGNMRGIFSNRFRTFSWATATMTP